MENKLIILSCVIAILLAGNILQFVWNNPSQLSEDAVPDEETALRIAEAVVVSAYGDRELSHASFNESQEAWVVYGSNVPDGYAGGIPRITIRKSDGKILEIYHSM